jgi:hypothetical protein
VRAHAIVESSAQNVTLFLSFSYDCPEPVFPNDRFQHFKFLARKKAGGGGCHTVEGFVTDRNVRRLVSVVRIKEEEDIALRSPAKTASLFQFSLCLSRACLGKMIII